MSTALFGQLVIAKSPKAVLQIINSELCITNGTMLFADDDVDLFCERLTAYWPLKNCEAYRWMVKRLSGYQVNYSNGCNGLLPAVHGKPVNMFGVSSRDEYTPCDDVDNLMDVVMVIKQVYGVE